MGRNFKKNKMKSYSPLRYPGGKGKLIKYFKELFNINDLENGIYVEPYAGGASVALALLIDGHASKIIINDIDRSIFAFWYSALYYSEELCDLIRQTPVNMKTWKKQKEIQKNKNDANLLELGFSTFFLNRTNRSGILKAGVIGGKKQNGKWKINARYKKKDLIARIRRISQYKDKIEIYNSDAVKLIKDIIPSLPSKTLIYLDPPYYNKGKQLYLNYYIDRDHAEIADTIKKVYCQKWIITYDEADLIRRLYQENKMKKYTLKYSAGKTKEGKELIIYSNNLVTAQIR